MSVYVRVYVCVVGTYMCVCVCGPAKEVHLALCENILIKDLPLPPVIPIHAPPLGSQGGGLATPLHTDKQN